MADKIISARRDGRIDYRPPGRDWMDPSVEFKKGSYCYAAPLKNQEALQLPNPRQWNPQDEDWKLPLDFKQIIVERHEGTAG